MSYLAIFFVRVNMDRKVALVLRGKGERKGVREADAGIFVFLYKLGLI